MALRGDIWWSELWGLGEITEDERGGVCGGTLNGDIPPILVSGTSAMLIQPSGAAYLLFHMS